MNKFFGFIFAIAAIALTSCRKDVADIQPRTEDPCYGFSQSQIDSFGLVHNQFIEQVYIPTMQSGIKDPVKLRQLMKFMASQFPIDGITPSQKDSLIEYSDGLFDRIAAQTGGTFQFKDWVNSPIPANALPYFIALQNQVNTVENYTQYVSAVDNVLSKAVRDTSLTCQQLEAIKITASVAKSSAYLWMPTYMGGLGWYDIYGAPVVQGKKKWSWKYAMAGDLSAAAGMCFEVAIAGAMTGGIALGPTIVVGAFACGYSSALTGAGFPG